MALDLYLSGVLIGSVVRGLKGCYAYCPAGSPVGQFADIDAAAHALKARMDEHQAVEAA